MKTIIYGASDDLIEVEGAFPEEFNHYSIEPAVLSIDGGAILLAIDYGRDGWTITAMSGSDRVTIIPARGEDEPNDEHGCPGYSQKAVIEGSFGVEYQGAM
ncbi:MAG: hypothetical protein JWP74_1724 [Marmoricola sp.]|nr:hypothetical protein [Marmoricola sp.]